MTSDTHIPEDKGRVEMERRTFLRASSLGLAGAAVLGSGMAHGADAEKSRLVRTRHANATDEMGKGDPAIVREMVDRAVMEFSGEKTLAAAWSKYFSKNDVVGIKLNLRGGRFLAPQPPVVDAILAGLAAAGVKEDNIIVWDMWPEEFELTGYTPNLSGPGVRYYAPERERFKGGKKGKKKLANFYSDKPTKVFDTEMYLNQILTEKVTAVINVPLFKDHMIAGVTCALKNHFGSVLEPKLMHGHRCAPYIAELNALPEIKDKTRLIVVDGLRALYHGGPHDSPPHRYRENSIVVGSDPVAMDDLALQVIEAKRKKEGKPSVRHMATFIQAAADIGLGTNDPTRIDFRDIDMSKEG